mgnify:CR=1 FL=1
MTTNYRNFRMVDYVIYGRGCLSQLDAILQAVARVSALDTGNVTPMSHPVPSTNVFREDVPAVSLAALPARAPCSTRKSCASGR